MFNGLHNYLNLDNLLGSFPILKFCNSKNIDLSYEREEMGLIYRDVQKLAPKTVLKRMGKIPKMLQQNYQNASESCLPFTPPAPTLPKYLLGRVKD